MSPWPGGRPRALLFDLDGCLVDSTRAITGCLNHALRAVGLPSRPVGELVRFIGPPLPDGMAALIAEAGAYPALAPAMIDHYRDRYAGASLTDTEVVPGIPEVLDQLGASAPLAVVTSKPEVFARPILERLGLAPRFAMVHAPPADHRGEDKATTLARALAELREQLGAGFAAEQAVMIGDRSHDVDAGRACGTRTVGVTWGAGDRAELAAAGADRIVDDPRQLAALAG